MFEKVIVLGVGKCALGCVQYLLQQGIRPEFYCVGNSVGFVQNQVKRLLGDNAAKNFFQTKQKMTEYLCSQEKRLLIVSAVNYYLFPAKVLEKENITAVNFHNAYLPRHPGLNAEAWAIYEQDEYAGVTWHYVAEQVDAGRIIVQEKIPLHDDTTSISLLSEQNQLALLLFKKYFHGIYEGTVDGIPQNSLVAGDFGIKQHYSWEKPNGGRLDLDWDADKISAFLRCFDYGIMCTMGKPFMCYEGKKYEWRKYKIEPSSTNEKQILKSDDSFVVEKDGKKIFLIGLNEMIDRNLQLLGG